jgi:hypothetical protein
VILGRHRAWFDRIFIASRFFGAKAVETGRHRELARKPV